MRWRERRDGEAFRLPRYDVSRNGTSIRCCDCGLVHRMAFTVTRGGYLYLTAQRDERATKRCRRQVKKFARMR